MRRLTIGLLWWGSVVAGWAADEATQPAAMPLNLSRAKAAVIAYHDDGRYAADLAAVGAKAQAWLRERAAARTATEQLAVVFDVDETVLSNYPHLKAEDFGYNHRDWDVWVAQAAAPALEPVRDVYGLARELGLAVIFLTGRKDPAERAGTAENLRRAGMGDYAQLILRTAEETAPTAAERKAARRAALEAAGYTIIASIGDQWSDLAGGHAERTFKLPNPFYELL